jgi:acyl-CoA thioesterase-1
MTPIPLIILGILVAGVVIIAFRLILLLQRKSQFESFWRDQLQATSVDNEIKVIMFGDSISQGVGATKPQYTLAGRVATYVQTQTGRPVRMENYSRSGATADHVINTQIPRADLIAADIILLEIGANDSFWRTPEQYQADTEHLIAILPLEKTVIADLPYASVRRPYQAKLLKIMDANHIQPAKVSLAFRSFRAGLRTTAGDSWHPNDKGYQLWFEAFQPGIDQVLQQNGQLKAKKE